ncbi:MAG TPA: GTPase ObgE [Acidimicrobiales bacterium]|nr:GTPase ObgE [Acidimicrobiales bacterium]
MPSFVDEAQLHVKGGDGGAGCVSFRREAHVSKGGPDGGDGGRGGDVWLVASNNQSSLLGFRDHPHRRAGNGTHGQGKQRSGARGEDLEVAIPLGTTVKTLDGRLVADLSRAGDRWLAASGGRGGRGNARFLTNRRRAPSFAEQGELGEEGWFDLELKLLADVALVGFPNSGKSTLISRLSAAKPKIADYPFTTLHPNLGFVRVGRRGDETEFVIADVPGLIEGAAEGRGLGHQFLRHVERARVLLVMLDTACADGLSVSEQERILLSELGNYNPELLERPRLTVGSRADIAIDGEELELVTSAVTGSGLAELRGRLAQSVARARAAEPAADGSVVVHRPLADGVEVRRNDDGSWEVLGRAATRAVAISDLTDDQAIDYVQHRLRRLGVERALVRSGVREGDTVHLGPISFTYHKDEAEFDIGEDEEASKGQFAAARGRRSGSGKAKTSRKGRPK